MNAHQCRSQLGQKCTAKMLSRFDVGAPMCSLLACCAPIKSGFFEQLGSVTMLGEQLRLAFGNFGELFFEGLNDAGVKRTSWLAKQRSVCRVLHQGMFEQVGRMRRRALPKQQTGPNETI